MARGKKASSPVTGSLGFSGTNNILDAPVKPGAAAATRAPAGADDLGPVHGVIEQAGAAVGRDAPHCSSGEPDWGLWYIHGCAYDLTGFMDQHPGELGRGISESSN